MNRHLSFVLLTAAILVTGLATAVPANTHEPELAPVARLAKALDSFRYPDNGRTKVTVWRQSTATTGSYSSTHDDDTITLQGAIATFEDGCKPMDLSAVAILSDSGRNVRFVDLTDKDTDTRSIKLKRGQLVILLAPPAGS